MLITFLIIGPKIEAEFQKFGVNAQSLVLDKSLKGFFKNETPEDYDAAIFTIQSEIDKNPQQIFHLIVYGHGRKDRIIHLGKNILPESIFNNINRPQVKIVMSVMSCYAGSGIKEEKPLTSTTINLCKQHIMLIYAGRRATISSMDTSKILTLIKSCDFTPHILFKHQDQLIISPPETIKIITSQSITKLSPLKIFKINSKPKINEILEELQNQQNEINSIFSNYLPKKNPLNEAFHDNHYAKEDQNMENYLCDLAFLIILTKCGEKMDYLRYLIDELNVDPSACRTIHEERHFLIIDACAAGNLEAIKFLVGRNAQLNVANDFGVTPLIAACYKGHDEILTYLLELMTKEQIKQEDNFGNSVLTIIHKTKCSDSTIKRLFEKSGS